MPPIQVGDVVDRQAVETIRGETIEIPHVTRLTHLQFRRFAGCPMCNLHLRSFVGRHQELADHGVEEVAVFHSSKRAMLARHARAPFHLVADPTRALYRRFGADSSILSILHPGAWLPALRGVLAGGWGFPAWRESPLGRPADFLLSPDGTVLARKYGAHAYDHWEVDELLALARTAAPR